MTWTRGSYACRCDGRYVGCEHGEVCGQPGGGHRSPYYCAACDFRRVRQIQDDLAAIQAAFDRREQP